MQQLFHWDLFHCSCRHLFHVSLKFLFSWTNQDLSQINLSRLFCFFSFSRTCHFLTHRWNKIKVSTISRLALLVFLQPPNATVHFSDWPWPTLRLFKWKRPNICCTYSSRHLPVSWKHMLPLRPLSPSAVQVEMNGFDAPHVQAQQLCCTGDTSWGKKLVSDLYLR